MSQTANAASNWFILAYTWTQLLCIHSSGGGSLKFNLIELIESIPYLAGNCELFKFDFFFNKGIP